MNDQARHERVMELFDEVCDLQPDQQTQFLRDHNTVDESIIDEVRALLRHDARPIEFVAKKAQGGGMEMIASELASGANPTNEAEMAEPLPKQIGRYKIIRKLGEGGMGLVYLAEQENPRRVVAVKVIKAMAASRSTLRRFEHEAHVLGMLQHPGIAQIFEAGTAELSIDGMMDAGVHPFFAMEYVDGQIITRHAELRNLGVRQRLELFMRVCEAVQHAHLKGVIHRDLKPANILVVDDVAAADRSNSSHGFLSLGKPKILDFGVARLTDADIQVTTMQTDAGQLVGTLQYMSPEQVSADPLELDTRSDVYALGVILYELLTGRPPYDLRKLMVHDAVRVIRDEEPSRLSSINRTFRGDLETITAKAMEKDKSRRYQSAADLAADIRRYLNDEPLVARPPSRAYQFRKFARRNKVLVGAVSAVALALCAAVLGLSQAVVTAQQQRDDAKVAEATERALRISIEHARDKEMTQRTEAQRQSRIAKAVNDFLNDDLLAQADPGNQPDRDITLRAALDRAAVKVAERFADEPEVQASIRLSLGRTYQNLGEHDAAEPQLREAWNLYKTALGEDDERALTAESSLADLMRLNGDYASAEQMVRRVILVASRLLGPEHELVLDSRDILATTLEKLNRYVEAEPLMAQNLEIRRRLHGEESPEALLSMRLLGLFFERNGKYAQAEEIMVRTIQAMIKAQGTDHPDTMAAMNNLALVYIGQQRYAEAEQVLAPVYDKQNRLLGERHGDTMTTLSNLATSIMGQHRLAEAEPLLEKKLAMVKEVLGPTHSDTLNAMNTLGGLYWRTKRYEDAESIHREVIRIGRETYGEKHLETMVAHACLMRLQNSMNRLDEAKETGEYAYGLMSDTLGNDHPITQALVAHLVQIAKKRGDQADLTRWEARRVKAPSS